MRLTTFLFLALSCVCLGLVTLSTTSGASPVVSDLKNIKGGLAWPELLAYSPVAPGKATVVSGNARFTVLTDRLVRMEYVADAANKGFEDRATTAFLQRSLADVPDFQTKTSDGVLTITTDAVELSYKVGAEFSADTLGIKSVLPKSAFTSWRYGDKDPKNLLGTIKSLDLLGVTSLNCTENKNITVHDESLHCAWGLVSRSGWAVVDDSDTYVLNPATGWWDQGQNGDDVDAYMFAHGHDYKGALKDFVAVSGKTAMVPRAAAGVWWTRWFNFNSNDLIDIVEEYEKHALPLDAFVLDMDWHKKNEWGGYTWDPNLFPYPADAMGYLKGRGLITLANIHDDNGVGAYEAAFPAMAKAMGVDPSSTDAIPFHICDNETYAKALEDLVLKPVEDTGMDYWWIDWQQGGTQGGCAGLKQNPTIWTNKIRGTDHIRRGSTKRGLVLSRWGGLGSHRYQVGFSGDVEGVVWSSLAYQPYFSLTSTNVGFGFWSHDIVGAVPDYELYARWLQWGGYSGVLRSHDRGMSGGDCAMAFPSTRDNDHCGVVRPWNVPLKYFKANRETLQRRSALVPYTYTLAREAYDTGLGPIRPMYYEFPEHDEAYLADQNGNFPQYFFGNDMIVSPVVAPADATGNGLSEKKVWLPPGEWVERDRGVVVSGPTIVTRQYALEETPVFVRAGAVIPTLPIVLGDTIGVASRAYEAIVWEIYLGGPGAELRGTGSFYEDDGETTAYASDPNEGSTTTASFKNDAGTLEFIVNSSTKKAWSLLIANALVPKEVSFGHGIEWGRLGYSRHEAKDSWTYDGAKGELKLNLPGTFKSVKVVVTWGLPGDLDVTGLRGVFALSNLAKAALDQVRKTVGSQTGQVGYGGALDRLVGTGAVLSYLSKADPTKFVAELNSIRGDNLVGIAMKEIANITLPSNYGENGTRRLDYVTALMEETERCL